METVLLIVGLLASFGAANLRVPFVQPLCDFDSVTFKGYNTCLRGQHCTENNTCVADYILNRDTLKALVPATVSEDSRCGRDFGGVVCDTGSNLPCCSQYGYCGNTTDHCLVSIGCQHGCRDVISTPVSNDAVSKAIPSSPSGGSEPVLSRPSTAANIQSLQLTGPPTTDGACGADFNNTICDNWPTGSCCSMYGYCGNSSAHCGDGCQSGPCLGPAAVRGPGPSPAPPSSNPGSFKVVGRSGVPAMHAALMPNGRVVFLDKVENYTELPSKYVAGGRSCGPGCTETRTGLYSYSSEYDPATNKVVALAYKTNAFCAGGIFLADGRLISIGGNLPLLDIDPTIGSGFNAIRYLERTPYNTSRNGQDWSEPGNKLASNRWYPSAQIMPDGSIFVASGSLNGDNPSNKANNNPTYEILNPDGTTKGVNIPMDILIKAQPYFMYPFIHLLRDGTVFIFAGKHSEIFDVAKNSTGYQFEDLIGDYRVYPNTGGSVMLPLSSSNNYEPDIVICGGGAYNDVTSPTDASCGRIQPFAKDAQWEMDSMPEGRGMVEGTLLPDGTVIWLNGANQGSQGFNLARKPTLEALIYDPAKPYGQRWTTGGKSTIPRLYHSVALLLLDGTIMVAGSNPVDEPMLQPNATTPYVTEFRVEIYTPPYLQGNRTSRRPTDIALSATKFQVGHNYTILFNAPPKSKEIKVALYYGGFVTHSVHMGQRMVYLDTGNFWPGDKLQTIDIRIPDNKAVVPPGPYVVYVVVDGVPGIGQFVLVS